MTIDLNSFLYQPQRNSPEPVQTRSKRNVDQVNSELDDSMQIPPLLDHNLLLVFTGFNPGVESGRTGHHYAHRSNRFWKLLHESGLTSEKLSPQDDATLKSSHRFGFTDLVARCTKGITQLSKQERLHGAAILEQRLLKFQPKYVCFIGKGIWDTVCSFKGWSIKNFQYGLQDRTFGNTKVIVLPSSSGLVSIPKQDQLVWWGQLKQLIDTERAKECILEKSESPESTTSDSTPISKIELNADQLEPACSGTRSFKKKKLLPA